MELVVTTGTVRCANLQSCVTSANQPNFYRLDAVPVAHPTVSKHLRDTTIVLYCYHSTLLTILNSHSILIKLKFTYYMCVCNELESGLNVIVLLLTSMYCLVFHCIKFCPSMVRPLKTINLVMASYSDVYCQSSRLHQLATTVLSGHKYFMNPDLRAKQVRNMYFT